MGAQQTVTENQQQPLLLASCPCAAPEHGIDSQRYFQQQRHWPGETRLKGEPRQGSRGVRRQRSRCGAVCISLPQHAHPRSRRLLTSPQPYCAAMPPSKALRHRRGQNDPRQHLVMGRTAAQPLSQHRLSAHAQPEQTSSSTEPWHVRVSLEGERPREGEGRRGTQQRRRTTAAYEGSI